MYDSSMKYKWDNKNVLDYAIKEAVEKAREEVRKKVHEEVAHEMKKEGIPLDQISKFTKLSIEEIEKL